VTLFGVVASFGALVRGLVETHTRDLAVFDAEYDHFVVRLSCDSAFELRKGDCRLARSSHDLVDLLVIQGRHVETSLDDTTFVLGGQKPNAQLKVVESDDCTMAITGDEPARVLAEGFVLIERGGAEGIVLIERAVDGTLGHSADGGWLGWEKCA